MGVCTMSDSSSCNAIIQHHDKIFDTIYGVLIVVGVNVSYLFQHVTFIKSKSSKGWSVATIFLGNLTNFVTLLSAIILQWNVWDCYTDATFGQYNRMILPLYVFFFSWLNVFVIFIFYLAFLKNEDDTNFTEDDLLKEKPILDEEAGSFKRKFTRFFQKYKKMLSLFVFFLTIGILLSLTIAMFIVLKNYTSPAAKAYGESLGALALGGVFIQWLPQIIKTL